MRTVSALLVALAATALPIAGTATAQDRDPGYRDDGGYRNGGGFPNGDGYRDGYGDDDGGYGYPPAIPDERGYGTQPPPPGNARPMPGYRDNGNWRSGETWSSTDARRDAAEAGAPPPPPPPATRRGDRQAYREAQADYRAKLDAWNRRYGSGAGVRTAPDPRYADRVARWRARADACEAGDRSACDGPE